MPQISAIEPQKKKKDRFNLFIDGQFAAGVSQLTVLANNLKVGGSLSKKDLERIILKEEIARLTDKVLRFLGIRPRSQKEVTDFLVEKIAKAGNISFSEAQKSLVIAPIIAKLKKYQYLNDQEFAKWWVSSRLRSNPRGARILKAELIQKGIARDMITLVLAKLPDQVNIAKRIIEKKLKRWQKLPPIEFKKKVYQYLVFRGFEFEIIKEVFANLEKKR